MSQSSATVSGVHDASAASAAVAVAGDGDDELSSFARALADTVAQVERYERDGVLDDMAATAAAATKGQSDTAASSSSTAAAAAAAAAATDDDDDDDDDDDRWDDVLADAQDAYFDGAHTRALTMLRTAIADADAAAADADAARARAALRPVEPTSGARENSAAAAAAAADVPSDALRLATLAALATRNFADATAFAHRWLARDGVRDATMRAAGECAYYSMQPTRVAALMREAARTHVRTAATATTATATAAATTATATPTATTPTPNVHARTVRLLALLLADLAVAFDDVALGHEALALLNDDDSVGDDDVVDDALLLCAQRAFAAYRVRMCEVQAAADDNDNDDAVNRRLGDALSRFERDVRQLCATPASARTTTAGDAATAAAAARQFAAVLLALACSDAGDVRGARGALALANAGGSDAGAHGYDVHAVTRLVDVQDEQRAAAKLPPPTWLWVATHPLVRLRFVE